MGIYLFADGNWLLYRAWSVLAKYSKTPEERVPRLMLDWFCKAALRVSATGGALCFDGDQNFRYSVYRDYKRGRSEGQPLIASGEFAGESTSFAVHQSVAPTTELFQSLGLKVAQDPQCEADDLLASGVTFFSSKSKGNHCYLMTRDKDLYQMLSSQVTMYTPESNSEAEVFLTPNLLLKKKGLTPNQFKDYQTLIGDPTDNVPAVKGMNRKKAVALLAEYSSLESYFTESKAGAKFYRDHSEELHRNRRLISMRKTAWKDDRISFDRLTSVKCDLLSFQTLRSTSQKGTLF